jgi:tetratricopeptide (TPR) repeat protein
MTIYKSIFFALGFIALLAGCSSESNDGRTEIDEQYHQDPLINELTLYLKKDPNNPELWVARAQAFYERQGYDEAIQDMSAAMRLDSTNVDYHHLLADIYMDYYKSRLALSTMQRAAVLHPTRIPTLLKLAELQLILTLNEESMRTIGKIMEIDPQNPDALLLFGLNFKETGDTARAIGSFQKAVEIDPELTDAWINLAQLRAARGEPSAPRFFDAAIRSDESNPLPRMAKADYYWEQKKYTDAIQTYRNVIELDNSYTDAFYNIGLVYLEMDSIDKAYENFNITINMNPLYYKAYYYRGLTSEMSGDTAAARKDYEQCSKMAPGFDKPRLAMEALDKQ